MKNDKTKIEVLELPKPTCFSYTEALTQSGEVISFMIPSYDHKRDDARTKLVKEFIRRYVSQPHFPETHGLKQTQHGSYGSYTRYDVVQHKYAGGGPNECGGWGYIEVLEVRNPPDGRHGIVINERTNDGGCFTEWSTLDEACKAFERSWSSQDTTKQFSKFPGFLRRVTCGALVPWFYAIGEEELIGEYAFPQGLQDDPVFRFGIKFLVPERLSESDYSIPTVKMCMGTRFINREVDGGWYDGGRKKREVFRLVYWSDGSVWNEMRNPGLVPRPLEQSEEWITEALTKFKQVLSGHIENFSIDFLDGTKFVGGIKKSKSRRFTKAGDYFVLAKTKESKPQQGWVNGFIPTPDSPDVISFIKKRFLSEGRVVERIEVKKFRTEKGEKKWSGAFFSS